MQANMENSLIPESVPVELTPVYRTDSVNGPVELYTGPLELTINDKSVSGDGVISWEWVPVPRVSFRMGNCTSTPPIPFSNGILKMSDGRTGTIRPTRVTLSGGENAKAPTVEGIMEPVEFGCGAALKSAIFHVPNFQSYLGTGVCDQGRRQLRSARAVIESDEWQVTFDEVRREKDGSGRSFSEQIQDTGGFGITHVAKLERRGGDSFSSADAKEVEEALFWFLSFCRGSWVAPLLAVGLDVDGNRSWEEWRDWKVERWRRVRSWFDTPSCAGLVEAFPGFVRRRKDATWKEPIELAIHWYVESNMCAGGVEGGTILAQAAFELLAWTFLVEDRRVLSEDGFQKLPASDKLRLLLSSCAIPLPIPSSMCELSNAALAFNWEDAPQAMTEVRNALVHANPKKRKKVLGGDAGPRHEAWWLSLWYLELVLLWLFDFRGKYSNRLIQNCWKGQEVELVPWASPS